MFQYALGRRLALEHAVPLKLDLTCFTEHAHGRDTPRAYALDGWCIAATFATAEDLRNFAEPPRGRLARWFRKVAPAGRRAAVREHGFGFSPAVLSTVPPALLIGYWQTEKYFASIAGELRKDFTLRHAPCEHALQALRQVVGSDAIAVHIRRGDYVHDQKTNAYHGVCGLEYYERAARLVAERLKKPHFIVVSDEPQWANQHLRLPWPTTYVAHAPRCVPHNDMWLMSMCSHHVIANSSFSWWGAWLSESRNKIVVAPKAWFRGAEVDTTDLIPQGWLRL
jgi:hypothetical protein